MTKSNETNIGWLYYKDYYSDLAKTTKPDFKSKSDHIADIRLVKNQSKLRNVNMPIPLTTTYPGVLIGSGYQHEAEGDNEFKVGFYFDYTSGLPVIPGSSVKGALRSAFPFHQKDLGDAYRNPRLEYIKGLIKNVSGIPVSDDAVKKLEFEIFEGEILKDDKATEKIPVYQRDIFYDAFILESKNPGKLFLSSDFITHHPDPLKHPNPVMFLKVRSQVEFNFQFKLTKSVTLSTFTSDHKRELFRKILLDMGIGAKTNVGYGQME